MNNTTTAPISFTENHPCLEIPEWQSLNGGLLRPLEASRHYLVLGETGSGKTLSAIRPWLRAAWAYPSEQEYRRYAESVEATGQVPESMEELNPGMLVIDPKGELKEFILHEQPKFPVGRKLIFLDIASPHYVIPWFDPAEAVQVDSYTIAARMLSLSAYMTREGYSRDPFWGKEAQDIIKALLSIDHAIVKQKKIRGLKLFWERVHDGVISNLKEWHAR
ncbi:MAG: hypothetical protein RDU20_15185, partial [Desulfomonilaceae bacterium]|nr:hypothetical protein [Desulfomonilaceae bacterium]